MGENEEAENLGNNIQINNASDDYEYEDNSTIGLEKYSVSAQW